MTLIDASPMWQLAQVSLFIIFVEKEMCQECPFCLCVWVCVLRVAFREFVVPFFICTLYLLNSACMYELVKLLESVMVCCTPGMRPCICEHVHVCKCIWPWMNSLILCTSYIFRCYFCTLPFKGGSVSMTKPCYHVALLGWYPTPTPQSSSTWFPWKVLEFFRHQLP